MNKPAFILLKIVYEMPSSALWLYPRSQELAFENRVQDFYKKPSNPIFKFLKLIENEQSLGSYIRNPGLEFKEINSRIEKAESFVKDEAMVVASLAREKGTTLTLKPIAKAVAGPRGIAVASPIARAVIHRGQPVTIDYDPDAVAIAGPGGQAHSHPKLEISYISPVEISDESITQTTLSPNQTSTASS